MKRNILAFSLLTVILILLCIINVCVGSVNISYNEIWSVLLGKGDNAVAGNVILNIRMPRLLAALFLGGALALSGYLLQTFFNNPIAGPFVLGISSGAKLVVALTMIFLLSNGIVISSFGMVAAAFFGAMVAMGFVLIISVKVRNMSILVVCGIMIGYICSAITDFAITFANDSNIINLHNWSLGSFSGINWNEIWMIVVLVVICVIATFLLSKPISAYQLGEAYARNMGVNIKLIRVLLILLASLLAATVTAFAGPISFVGIAVPHLMKLLIKSNKPIIMIPICFLGGADTTLFCDLIARTAFAPTEVSISSVTAVILVPVVISMMISKKSK